MAPKTAHNIEGEAAPAQSGPGQSPPRCGSVANLLIGLDGHPPLEKQSSLKLDVFNIWKVPGRVAAFLNFSGAEQRTLLICGWTPLAKRWVSDRI